MKKQIKQCLTRNGSEKNTAQFLFPTTFIGFCGHFPNQPVVPGVCLIQAALIAVDETLKLTSIKSAKFFSVVQPDVPVLIKTSLDGEQLTARITANNEKIAQLQLTVSHA